MYIIKIRIIVQYDIEKKMACCLKLYTVVACIFSGMVQLCQFAFLEINKKRKKKRKGSVAAA